MHKARALHVAIGHKWHLAVPLCEWLTYSMRRYAVKAILDHEQSIGRCLEVEALSSTYLFFQVGAGR